MTSSDSAIGMSKGVRISSASAAIMKMTKPMIWPWRSVGQADRHAARGEDRLRLGLDDAHHRHRPGLDHHPHHRQHQRQLVGDQLGAGPQTSHERVLVRRRPSRHEDGDGAHRPGGQGVEDAHVEVAHHQLGAKGTITNTASVPRSTTIGANLKHRAVGVVGDQVLLLEELQPVGEQLGPAPAAPGEVGADAALHVGRHLQLGEDDDQGNRRDDDGDDRHLEDEQHPEVVEQAHRSTSPSTKSRLPRMAMMSGTSCPSSSQGSTERLQNEAERIFTR